MILFCWDRLRTLLKSSTFSQLQPPLVLGGRRISVSVNVKITFALVLKSLIGYCGEQNLLALSKREVIC